jgi:phage major head subunit gpT-like protein
MTPEELKRAIEQRDVKTLARLEAPRVHCVRAESINEEERSVEAVLATETPVEMMDWDRWEYVPEVLTAAGMRIRGGRTSVPILDSHDRRSTKSILGVVKDIRVEGGQVVGRLVFDDTEEGRAAWIKVKSGSLTDVSVGYGVAKRVFIGEDTTQNINGRDYTGPVNVVMEWELKELSPTPIGADVNAVMRSEAKRILNQSRVMPGNQKEDLQMPEPKENPGADPATEEERNAPSPPAPAPKSTPEPVDLNAVRKAERERITIIRSLAAEAGVSDETLNKFIDDGSSVDKARAAFWETFAGRNAAQGPKHGGDVQVTRDERDQLRENAVDALLVRTQILSPEKASKGHERFLGSSLASLARECVVASGRRSFRDASRLEGQELFLAAMAGRNERTSFINGRSGALNHSTSDFPYILANVANKSLQQGYEQAPTSYQFLARIVSRPDFKTNSVTALSDGPAFELVNENGEIPQGSLSEKREQYALATYGRKMSITRQTLINDDLGAFTRIPAMFGRAARILLNKLYWSRLLANSGTGETMADGNPIFDATNHANYTSSGTAMSVTSFGVARAAMMKQTGFGEDSDILNISPAFLLVSPTKSTLAEQLVGSAVDPAKSNNTPNPFYNKLRVISDAFMENGFTLNGTTYSGAANPWIMLASYNDIDTIEMGLLNGIDAPSMMENENSGDILGMSWTAWIDGAAKAIDWRGMYRNAGA